MPVSIYANERETGATQRNVAALQVFAVLIWAKGAVELSLKERLPALKPRGVEFASSPSRTATGNDTTLTPTQLDATILRPRLALVDRDAIAARRMR